MAFLKTIALRAGAPVQEIDPYRLFISQTYRNTCKKGLTVCDMARKATTILFGLYY